MIDSTLYDFLEKIVDEQNDNLKRYQEIYDNNQFKNRVGINAVQSIIRRSVLEESSEDTSYSKVVYTKDGYQSIKLSNLKFNLDFILALLASVPSLVIFDKWAILMVILTIFAELRHCKVKLSPTMGIIITYLYKNGYQKKNDKYITLEELKKEIQSESITEKDLSIIQEQFDSCIDSLVELKVIDLVEEQVSLIEEITI